MTGCVNTPGTSLCTPPWYCGSPVTPGAIITAPSALTSVYGNDCTRSLSTVETTADESRASSGVSAFTVTVSVAEPTSSVTSTVAVCAVSTSTDSTTPVLKPASSTVSRYGPGGTEENT
jgi:hypothetical protein